MAERCTRMKVFARTLFNNLPVPAFVSLHLLPLLFTCPCHCDLPVPATDLSLPLCPIYLSLPLCVPATVSLSLPLCPCHCCHCLSLPLCATVCHCVLLVPATVRGEASECGGSRRSLIAFASLRNREVDSRSSRATMAGNDDLSETSLASLCV
jgi:hypothetical protein